eukprot:2415258-Alexandrium_andersonii.AAC.1
MLAVEAVLDRVNCGGDEFNADAFYGWNSVGNRSMALAHQGSTMGTSCISSVYRSFIIVARRQHLPQDRPSGVRQPPHA